ncbi:hypothetical protein BJV77DRAFT_1069026 [Russula vinacea]|nr:hypothetical protein BJV77DRAFT_1069026 [Russula vinacea]
MNSSSPFTDVPRTTPPPSPPPSFSPHPLPGDTPGLCGLTGDQWHMVMVLSIPCDIVALLIALVISWFNDSEISFLWLRMQERAKMTRMGASHVFPSHASHDPDELFFTQELREMLFGHLLSEDDVRSGLIVTGPSITPRRYPIVNFILAQLRAPARNESEP